MRQMPFEVKFTYRNSIFERTKKAKMIVPSKSKANAVKRFKEKCKEKHLSRIEITSIINLVDEKQEMLFKEV